MSQSKLPVDVLLSLSTVPVLLLLISGKAIGTLLQDIGQASEEIFRGDRLPALKTVPSEAAGDQS